LGFARLRPEGAPDLSNVERAFRSCKTVDLDERPVYHWNEDSVRAHVFLCLLAYHLEWHMRQALAPLLFDDHERAATQARPRSPVAKASVSPAAQRKAASQAHRGRPSGP
jgi:hypothetical protein